ncbi:hypothetical protein SAMN04488498_12437 [Mesorhizobium albiziae]|uniref:DUF2169 domain-containing protein n=1 Tax=Neomesorhizobium albiziae TaxID=335020 RepID=A0A1I4EDX4_9HYPH|nr:DUF2169 domain-containing protein [Mesorhizobium albiziae]GLS31130.1 hypothetical protein GCM10007937_28390 [Mesorhizobium albiziae]SFL02576.1 hypothetical protein SAMN04488498_12437 [Mesorhizobium albiziae]
MQIWDQMGYPHEFTMATDVAGHDWIVVVVKGTFDFPETPNAPVRKSAEQMPLVFADTQTGEPGYSATVWETDFAFRKPRCDVILNGCAYSPGGRPAERVPVGVKVGNWSKLFEVVGNREWRAIGPVFSATSPQPFLKMPISYDNAWGGVDTLNPEDKLPGAYLRNPVGTGWAQTKNQRFIPGLRLPNTQAVGEEIRSPFGDYKPMSFGPMGRGWPGRIEYGGTYDQNWIDNIFPFLPADFDERYFQMAPPDQQIDLPRGGEEVQLVNLTPEGRVSFRLPSTALPMTLFKGQTKAFEAMLGPDTILFDPENRRFSLVWRVSQRIPRTILDFSECWIGPPTRGMLRARAKGKRYVRRFDLPPRDEEAEAA